MIWVSDSKSPTLVDEDCIQTHQNKSWPTTKLEDWEKQKSKSVELYNPNLKSAWCMKMLDVSYAQVHDPKHLSQFHSKKKYTCHSKIKTKLAESLGFCYSIRQPGIPQH